MMADTRGEKRPQYDAHEFWMEQDFQTSARLHLRNWIWEYQLGYVLHPTVDIPMDKEIRIADIACSNGAWMLDVARRYPQATIQGFDISPANFPHKSWTLPNMSFHTWDAFQDVPEEYVGAFDIVHVRALFSAIVDNNVGPVVENAMRMLKPGGYIQWEEVDPHSLAAEIPPRCEASGDAAKTLTTFFRSAFFRRYTLDHSWLKNLPRSFSNRGCKVLANDQVAPCKELQRAWCDDWLTMWWALITTVPEMPVPIPRVKGLPEMVSREWFVKTFNETAEECRQGVWLKAEQVVVVARKSG